MEAGKSFLAVEIGYRPQAVDVPADLEAVKRILEDRVSSQEIEAGHVNQ